MSDKPFFAYDIKKDTGFVPKVDFEEGITLVINKIRSDMETSNK